MRPLRLGISVVLAVLLGGCGGGATPNEHPQSHDTLFLEGPGKYDKLVALDTRTGRARTLPITGCGCDADFCLVPSGGKLVIASPGKTSVYDPSRPGPPRAQQIGTGWEIVPSATPGKVWLAIRDHRRKTRGTWPALKLGEVREETVGGRVTESARAPGLDWWPGGPGSFPAGAVKAGLVFVTDDGLRIWNPRTQAVTVRVPGRTPLVVDTNGNLVAWSSLHGRTFPITNARTGETRRMKPPPGYSFHTGYDGAFSPDGSLLALPVVATRDLRPNNKPRDDAKWSIALVDVSEGNARIVKGSRLDPIYQPMAWSASGSQLFFNAGEGRIMAYRLRAQRASLLARVHGTVFHMAAL
jgi:hypothetical protein